MIYYFKTFPHTLLLPDRFLFITPKGREIWLEGPIPNETAAALWLSAMLAIALYVPKFR